MVELRRDLQMVVAATREAEAYDARGSRKMELHELRLAQRMDRRIPTRIVERTAGTPDLAAWELCLVVEVIAEYPVATPRHCGSDTPLAVVPLWIPMFQAQPSWHSRATVSVELVVVLGET